MSNVIPFDRGNITIAKEGNVYVTIDKVQYQNFLTFHLPNGKFVGCTLSFKPSEIPTEYHMVVIQAIQQLAQSVRLPPIEMLQEKHNEPIAKPKRRWWVFW